MNMEKMEIGPIQERDSCMALVLIFLICWLIFRESWLVYLAMAALLLGMIWPAAMRPFAVAWFALARVLGNVMSKALLALVWGVLVVPVGYARRKMGKDSLGLRQWRKDDASVFVKRDHKYRPEDMHNPY